jgi:integrase
MAQVLSKSLVDMYLRQTRNADDSREITDARVPGLELRIRPRDVTWCYRWQDGKKSNRLKLGSAHQISVENARRVAAQAAIAREAGVILDDRWIAARHVELGLIAAEDLAEGHSFAAGEWTFADARTAYLANVARTKSSTTHADYRQILQSKDLSHLDPLQVSTISRIDLAEIVADIHGSGRETHADHVARVLRPFWNWLGLDAQQKRSGVLPGVMSSLRPPERSRVDDDDEEHGTYVPSLAEMGRAIALARNPAIAPAIGCAVELLIWTVQRRRAIAEARIEDFIPIGGGEGLWRVPPASRKGRKRNGKRKRPLVVPLPAPVWACVKRALKARGQAPGDYLFPAAGKSGHMHVSTLTHMIGYLPGITASGHDMRRGFATHGEALLGLLRADTKSILDHEDEAVSTRELTHRTATGTTDMTGVHYSLHDGTHRTWPIMRAWTVALDVEVEKALADPFVSDAKAVGAAIALARRVQAGREVPLQIAAE